jgi:hypothetical protein
VVCCLLLSADHSLVSCGARNGSCFCVPKPDKKASLKAAARASRGLHRPFSLCCLGLFHSCLTTQTSGADRPPTNMAKLDPVESVRVFTQTIYHQVQFCIKIGQGSKSFFRFFRFLKNLSTAVYKSAKPYLKTSCRILHVSKNDPARY